jgi:HTH-type transcriptional regulator/antitoxin MqsA
MERGLSILWTDAICGSVQNSMTPPEKPAPAQAGEHGLAATMTDPACPETGAPMHRRVHPLTLTYKGASITVDMPGWYCDQSEESIHTGADMKVSDRALNRLKARTEGLPEPEGIRRTREKLGLTQEAAGEIIGGGPRAFRKSEMRNRRSAAEPRHQQRLGSVGQRSGLAGRAQGASRGRRRPRNHGLIRRHRSTEQGAVRQAGFLAA